MGDARMVVLASIVHRGCMRHIQKLNLSGPLGATDEGIVALARAIDAKGLPELRQLKMGRFNNVTAFGFSAMMLAFVKGCPKSRDIILTCPDEGRNFAIFESMVEGMRWAANRWGVMWRDKGYTGEV